MDTQEDKPSTPTKVDSTSEKSENTNPVTNDTKIEKEGTSEIPDKKDEEDTTTTTTISEKKDTDSKEKEEEVKNDNIKVENNPTMMNKFSNSNSSISTPKSILRKRRTGGDEYDGSSDSLDETSSISSTKKKHIEFSDDNIVYTLKQEDEYNYDDEDEDDEAYKGHPAGYENESRIYSILGFMTRYLIFGLVIAAGFCFSYYSYNSNNNKKSHSGRGRGRNIQGKNKPGPPSIQWDNIATSSKTTRATPLKRIDSITMSDILSANPSLTTSTSVFQSKSTSTVVPGEQSKEDTLDSTKKDSSAKEVKIEKRKKSEKVFKRVVAVGDIHGDYKKLIKVLHTAKIIDNKSNWIAKDTILIQTGDLIDRGNDTILIFDLMMKLKEQAKKHGCILYLLLGNHELMNLQEDYRYVTRGDVISFGGMANRRKEFSLDGKYGKLLRSEMNATMIIDDTLFVHAGLTTVFAKYGVDQMNDHIHYILKTYPADQLFYAPIFSNNGPFWTRFLSMGQEVAVCEELNMVLEMMNVKRMVVGHTVQENRKINTRCGNKFLLIDVGMSEFYGGAFAYLEFLNDKNEIWAVYSDTNRERID